MPRAPHYTAAALSPAQCDFPRLRRGGGVFNPSPSSPPCAAQLSPIRPGPAQPASTHGSDSSGSSSPAPASPPPTPGRSSAAGSEQRGAWRVGTRGAFALGTGSYFRPTSSLRWSLSRLWEVWSSLCPARVEAPGTPGAKKSLRADRFRPHACPSLLSFCFSVFNFLFVLIFYLYLYLFLLLLLLLLFSFCIVHEA